jgi:3-isopropylmalate dehydrogenase
MILSVAMLVRWMGDNKKNTALQQAGDAMHAAVDKVLEDPNLRTADLGGSLGCKAFGEAVAKAIQAI